MLNTLVSRSRETKVNVVGYYGKLVVQGKEMEEFVLNTLEPEVLGEARYGYDEIYHPEWFELHAGMDESAQGRSFRARHYCLCGCR